MAAPGGIKAKIMETLAQIPQNVPTAKMVLLIRNDGLLVAAYPQVERLEGVGAQLTAIYESIERMTKQFNLGKLRYTVIVGENATIVILKGEKLSLAVVGDRGLNLGFVLTNAEGILDRAHEILSA